MPSLAPLVRLKRYLGQVTTDDDVLLQEILDGVSEEFRQYACTPFQLYRFDDVYSGSGNGHLLLASAPLVAVLSVSVAGRVVTDAVRSSSGSLFRSQGWPTYPYGSVSVSYTAGYATVPEDVQQQCVGVAALRYKLKEHIGMTSRSKGNSADTYSDSDLPQAAKDCLDKYREPALAIAISSTKTLVV